jgi:flagellar biosynthesis protein FliR
VSNPVSPDPIQSALLFVPTFAAVLLRVGAMFIFAPLFGSGRIPKKSKAMFAIVLAACLSATVRPVAFPPTIWTLTAAMVGEILFGLAMGMVLSVVFIAAQWAGEIIGQQLGFTLGAVFDPQYGGAGSVVSDLLYMLTLSIFLGIGGHHAMLLGLHKSFDALPLFTAGISHNGTDIITGLLTSCTTLAMKLVAPTIVAMMVTDVVLGFVSKTMPQLNVMSMGMNVKSLVGILILAGGITLTSDTMRDAITDRMYDVIHLFTHGL